MNQNGLKEEEEPIPRPISAITRILFDCSTSDVESVRQIREAFPVEANAPSRLYADRSGNTILQVAAVCKKAETISCIMAK